MGAVDAAEEVEADVYQEAEAEEEKEQGARNNRDRVRMMMGRRIR